MTNGHAWIYMSGPSYVSVNLRGQQQEERETAKLSCTISSNPSTIGWVQQKAGQAPHFVHCDGCSSRGPGIPNRFTASRSGNMGYLTISSLQAEDEADYYCYMWYSSGRVFHDGSVEWGTETKTSSLLEDMQPCFSAKLSFTCVPLVPVPFPRQEGHPPMTFPKIGLFCCASQQSLAHFFHTFLIGSQEHIWLCALRKPQNSVLLGGKFSGSTICDFEQRRVLVLKTSEFDNLTELIFY
uniref:Ig-like domain-containing protein n=1 Tax=Varanus komodoensis TaxID=61221 RepID=A0A8D2LBJ3_VARKO